MEKLLERPSLLTASIIYFATMYSSFKEFVNSGLPSDAFGIVMSRSPVG
jgi:hypothetical protein